MALAAGYRSAHVFDDLEDLRIRLPELLVEDGPVLIELHTSEAEQTPMTARGGLPFGEQIEQLRRKLIVDAPSR
jgi:hypothetical protein